jgi:hypothetical protein
MYAIDTPSFDYEYDDEDEYDEDEYDDEDEDEYDEEYQFYD